MGNTNHPGGTQGGSQGANTAGNKNQVDGEMGHNPNRSENKSQHGTEQRSTQQQGTKEQYSSNVNKNSGPQRTQLAQKFSQKHGLNQQQSENAADSFLGSVTWASQQKRDQEFTDFVNPNTQTSNNALYNGWQGEYKNRLRKNGFDESQTKTMASEEVDSYFKDLSSNGADENWYRNYGNDGRDVSDNIGDRSDSASRTDGGRTNLDGTRGSSESRIVSEENSDSSDAEGMASRKRRTEEEELESR